MKTNKPVIRPVDEAGDCRTGTLSGISVAEITDLLGFGPNVKDDPSKVKHSWGFTVDGERCGVWDYKGSEEYRSFSTFGSPEALAKVFGSRV
jgi:hypothetical protein